MASARVGSLMKSYHFATGSYHVMMTDICWHLLADFNNPMLASYDDTLSDIPD